MIRYRELPPGVLNINLIQLFSTVGFAVLMGLLNFYLKDHSPLSGAQINTLTASFFALNFLLHFLGGALGGRFLSFRALFFISLCFQIVGLFGIASGTYWAILAGMAAFVTGSGLNVSCINMMLTQLFAAQDRHRRIAFSLNYSFMNIGFLMSFVVSGYLQQHNLYDAAFYFATICLLMAIALHFRAWRFVADKSTYFALHFAKSNFRFVVAPLSIIACFLGALYLVHHATFASYLIYVVFLMVLAYMLYFASFQSPQYRRQVFAFLLFTSASMVFACVQGLQATALLHFTQNNTTMSLLGLTIAPATVNAFETLGVVVFGALLALAIQRHIHQKKPYSSGYLITKGLSLYVIAFLAIPVGIYLTGGPMYQTSVLVPIILLLIVAAGEVHVNSVNYALVGELIEPRHQGLFTGYLFVNIAVGVNLAGPISNTMMPTNVAQLSLLQSNLSFIRVFLVMACVALIIAVVFGLLAYRINQHLKPEQQMIAK